jgi:hypothetical protein
MLQNLIKFATSLSLVLTMASFARATEYTSTNFTLRDPVIGTGGGTTDTSTNFKVDGTLGDQSASNSSSTNFIGNAGYEQYDSTAPIGGSVADGSGADVDSQTSITSIEANWSTFSDPESGIASYTYRLVRDSDGKCWNAGGNSWDACEIWNSRGTNTSVTLTHANLALRTSTIYTFCVKASNNAGATSSAVCSDGIIITPSVGITSDAGSVSIPPLGIANSWNSTADTVVTADTNAYNGYSVYASKSNALWLPGDHSQTITDVNDSSCNGTAVSWPGAGYFGFTSTDDVDGNKFNSGGSKYCAIPTTSGNELGIKVADRTTSVTGETVNEDHTITYRTQVASTQAAGAYQTSILYTIVANY